jgi:DNA-binding SARP family transcriptional activator
MLRLRLLGAVDLTTPEGQALESALRQPKRMAVLAYLAAARPRGFHRRDKLAALFWPELNEERARAALRTTLSRLRDDLGNEVIAARGSDEVGIDPRALWCDVVALDAALAAGDLPASLALYRGPFLDGVHVEGAAERLESWISEEREALRQRLLTALSQASATAASEGRQDDAIALASHAVRVSPTDEQVARRLIAMHLAAGDRGSAAAAYEALALRLRREFEVEPSAETRALLDGARPASDPDVPSSRGPTLRVRPPVAPRTPPAGSRGMRVGLVAALLAIALAAVTLPRRLAPTPGASQWQASRVQEGTVLQLTLPFVVLDSTESALIVGFGAEAFHPLRLNPRTLRLTGLGTHSVGWRVLNEAEGARPVPRWGAAAIYDPDRDRLFLAGGARGTTAPCTQDVWWSAPASGLTSPPAWTEVQVAGDAPPARTHATIAFDAGRLALVLYGGNDCFTVHFHDLWILQFADSLLESGTWRRIAIDSSAGAPRALPDAAVVVDLERDRILALSSGLADSMSNALWELTGLRGAVGARWRRLECASPPPARQNSAMVIERPGQSMLLFGGLDAAGRELGDLWRLTFEATPGEPCRWTRIETAGDAPFPRTSSALFVSSRRERLLVLGGKSQQAALNDLWELPLSTRPAGAGSRTDARDPAP